MKPLDDWKDCEVVICKPTNLQNIKKIKLIKRGFKSLIKDPSIFFNPKKIDFYQIKNSKKICDLNISEFNSDDCK